MKAAMVFVVFASLFIVHVDGQAKTSVRRCLCLGRGIEFARMQRIDKIEIYPPSASCENVEMIIVFKNGAGKKCLNPKSKFAKNYVEKARIKRGIS